LGNDYVLDVGEIMAETKYMESQVYDVSLGSDVYKVYVSLGAGGTTATVGIFNVLDYGAARDGSTDDTAAIQAAIDAAEAAGGGTVKIPAGDYLISSALTVEYNDDRLNIEIDAVGANIFAASGHADDLLRIGSDSERSRNVIVRGGKWSIDDTDYTNTTGINLLNAVNCSVRDVVIFNCEKGLALRGTNSMGCVYNTIFKPEIWDCGFGIHLSCDANSGWVNANNIYGGLVSYSSSLDAVDLAGYYAIGIIPDASYDNEPNSNTFYGVATEISGTHSGTMPGSVYVSGYQNVFDNVREEGFDTPYYEFHTNARYTKIKATPANGNTLSSIIADADTTKANVYTNTQTMLVGGSADVGGLVVRSRSGGYRGIEIFETTATTPRTVLWNDGQIDCRVVELDPRAAPSTPAEGMLYYDATANKLLFYNGSAWVASGLWDGHTELSDTAYTDLVIAPSNFKIPASSNPTEITWLTDLKAYSFATGEYIHLDGIQLPHGYAEGTDLLFHVHFVPAADITDGEVVRFTLTYTISSPFYGFPATATVTTDFTNDATWRAGLSAGQAAAILSGTTVASANNPHLITTSGTISGTGLNLSSVLAGKVEYTATGTTYTGEAIVTSMDFHYQINRLGSENEFTG